MPCRNNGSRPEPRKRIVVPFFILQVAASILYYIFVMGGVNNTNSNSTSGEVYLFFFSGVTLVLIFMEFILYFFHRLYPFTFLCLEITKTIIEPTLFGIYIVEQVLGLQGFITNDVSDAINIFSLIFLCSFPVTLVYSALLYHRHHTYNKQRDTELLSGSAETAARSKSTCDDGREESNSQEIHEMALLQRTALETEGRPLCEMA